MGTQIVVTAQTVNLNGNERIKDKEPEFIKSYIDFTYQDRRNSYGDYIQKWGMASNAIKARSYHKWAETHLGDKIGIMQSAFFISRKKDSEALRSYLKTYFGIVPPNGLALIKWDASVFDGLNYAEYFIINNRPDKVDDPYTVTENREAIYRTETEEGETIYVFDHFEYSSTITYSDGSTDVLSTTSLRSNTTQQYLYARCTTQDPVDPTKKITLVLWYPQYSGDETLDTFFSAPTADFYTYLTPIPIRIDNKFPDEDPQLRDYLFPAIKKSWRMCHTTMNSKSDYKAVKKMLEDSGSLSDIDYAYVVHGVNIAGQSTSEKAYIYSFFYDIHAQDYYSRGLVPGTIGIAYDDWLATDAAQAVINDSRGVRFFNTDLSIFYYINYRSNIQRIFAKGNYGIEISIRWSITGYFLMTGLAEPGAKKGKYYTSYETSTVTWEEERGGDSGEIITVTKRYYVMQCKYQISSNQYIMIAVANPIHDLVIYRGRMVSTELDEGFHPKDGADFSNFILPINIDAFIHTPLLKEDAVAENMYYLVCESYVVKHTSWFQDFFSIILCVVGAILCVIPGCQQFGYALIAAAMVMIAMQAITPLLVAIFGEKLGGIIASILRVVITIIVCYFTFGLGAAGGSFSFTSIMSSTLANLGMVAFTLGVATFAQGFASGMSFGEALFSGIMAGVTFYVGFGGLGNLLPGLGLSDSALSSMYNVTHWLDNFFENPLATLSESLSGDALSTLASELISNPTTWLNLANFAVKQYTDVQLDEIQVKFERYMEEYKRNMNQLKNFWEEEFGLYSVNSIAVIQLSNVLCDTTVNGNIPLETDTVDMLMQRTLMCGSDIADTVLEAISGMCDSYLTLTLPRLDN